MDDYSIKAKQFQDMCERIFKNRFPEKKNYSKLKVSFVNDKGLVFTIYYYLGDNKYEYYVFVMRQEGFMLITEFNEKELLDEVIEYIDYKGIPQRVFKFSNKTAGEQLLSFV